MLVGGISTVGTKRLQPEDGLIEPPPLRVRLALEPVEAIEAGEAPFHRKMTLSVLCAIQSRCESRYGCCSQCHCPSFL
jgi:hypothetical protein